MNSSLNYKPSIQKSVAFFVFLIFTHTSTIAGPDASSLISNFNQNSISHARTIPITNVYSRSELRQILSEQKILEADGKNPPTISNQAKHPPHFFNSAAANQNDLLDALRRFVLLLDRGEKKQFFNADYLALHRLGRIQSEASIYPGVKLTFMAKPPPRFLKRVIDKPKSKKAGSLIVQIYHKKNATTNRMPVGIIAGNLQTRSKDLLHIFFLQLNKELQGMGIVRKAFKRIGHSLPKEVTKIELNILHFATLTQLAHRAIGEDPEWAKEFDVSDLVVKQDFANLYNALVDFLKRRSARQEPIAGIFPSDFLAETDEGALLRESGFSEPQLGFREYESRQVPGEIRADLHIIATKAKVKKPQKSAMKKKPNFFENRNFLKAFSKSPLLFLDDRHRRVLELHYGLNGNKRHSLIEIAPLINVTTSERVRQLEEDAMEKVKLFYESKLWHKGSPKFLNTRGKLQPIILQYILSLLPHQSAKKANDLGIDNLRTLLYAIKPKSLVGRKSRRDRRELVDGILRTFRDHFDSAEIPETKPDSAGEDTIRSELRKNAFNQIQLSYTDKTFQFESLGTSNSMDAFIFDNVELALDQVEDNLPPATTDTRNSFGGALGIDLVSDQITANQSDVMPIIGLLPSYGNIAEVVLQAAKNIDGKFPFVVFVETPLQRRTLEARLPDNRNVLVVTEANLDQLMNQIPGRAELRVVGNHSFEDRRYFQRLDILLKTRYPGRIELNPKMFNPNELDGLLGIAELASNLRSKLRKAWAVASAA